MDNDTNPGTQLYSRVCSAHQDLGRPRLGSQGQRSSCSEFESPGRTKPSTGSKQTTPPTAPSVAVILDINESHLAKKKKKKSPFTLMEEATVYKK
ncbi:uncharacterized [Tachysurus ichikawai]